VSGFSFFPPIPALASLVETIWDVDLPDAATAAAMTFNVLPGVSPTLCVHFRAPSTSNQRINPGNLPQRVTGIQTQLITVRPAGPVGATIVHFQPEAGYRFFGSGMDEFTDANVGLADLCSPSAAALLDERVRAARTPGERITRVQEFLLQHLTTIAPDLLVQHAVRQLCNEPHVPVRKLAADLRISQRQLSRRFRLRTGAGLKQFARVARFGQVIRARRRGHAWSQIAQEAGFSDQAHLIHDFQHMTGHAPQSLLPAAAAPRHRHLNAALAMSGFFNTFVV
jgi:AraC-like DNA-binding protein